MQEIQHTYQPRNHVIHVVSIICDIIWENLAYEGANKVFLDQPFSHINIHRQPVFFLIVQEAWKVL